MLANTPFAFHYTAGNQSISRPVVFGEFFMIDSECLYYPYFKKFDRSRL